MIIERVPLAGIGICHTATTASRQRVGVIHHHTGRRDLVFYDPDDPDRAAHAVVLDAIEARHLADLLAAAGTVDHLPSPVEDQPTGISIARIHVPAGSPHEGHPLRDIDTAARVVAVIRAGHVIPPHDPSLVLRPGDTLVAAGNPTAVTTLADQITPR